MIRGEGNVIRPRKSTNWSPEALKPRKGPIFKIGENDFAVNVPPANLSYNYYSNNTPAPNKKTSDIKKGLMKHLEKYCENTTLHGLRYIGDSSLSFGERIFWFISFALALGFAAYYISNIYTKWKSSPVIISFSPFDADLDSIPFPAITICNMNQAKKIEAEKILKEGSITEKKLLDDACNGNATFDNSENISWEALRDFLVRVGNSCSDMLKSCQWGSNTVNCDDIFNNDLTDEGLCCSFNRLPPEKIFRNWKDISMLNQTYPSNVYDWDAETGFPETDTDDFIPRRPLGAGAHLGLSIVLDAQVDNYYCSSTKSTGFKVILSNPIETPKMADFGFLISPGFETRVSIEPSVREATSSLRDVPIEKRQCYFANERPLQYYRKYSEKHCNLECQSFNSLLECGCIPYYLPNLTDRSGGSKNFIDEERRYTQKNCILECQSNFTLRQCNCLPYYLPKNMYVSNCAKADEKCISKVKQDVEDLKNGSFLDGECSCKSPCFQIKFQTDQSSSLLMNDFRSKDNITYNKKSINVATFFYSQEKYQKQVKTFLYGFSEILSNFGGILSLCLGISFLSVVEIFYYLSLKLICTFVRNKKKNNLQQRRRKQLKKLQLNRITNFSTTADLTYM